MKLYLTPGACSLADHIAIREAGIPVDIERVDLQSRTTETGADFTDVNPKGYVPALVLDDGLVLTENVAILSWVADRDDRLAPAGAHGRARLVEMLAFIATEIHRPFMRFSFSPADAEKAEAQAAIVRRLDLLAGRLDGGQYLFGPDFSAADAFLYVMTRWARDSGFDVPPRLSAHLARVEARPAVREALAAEGLA
ncbi:glutathione S-transferase C-terminal domain-containing protein [Bauldia litoralis]|uniref:Glutathione S-transferase n=1 Tax=Bauldia litoralis TaxID=665467 RepID=A0A1G6B3V4_9HYPH|nr:glutathione S-transferase C-terminal domain-containing protein [Bauldia litoralis]SDB15347.1 glutathione S-transferase [Bauldia litoralis]